MRDVKKSFKSFKKVIELNIPNRVENVISGPMVGNIHEVKFNTPYVRCNAVNIYVLKSRNTRVEYKYL